jgi:hypothetical protein
VRLVRVESVEGTEPVKRLFQRYRYASLRNPPRKEGRGPTNKFPPRSRFVNPVRVDKVVGKYPVKRFEARGREDNLVNVPR